MWITSSLSNRDNTERELKDVCVITERIEWRLQRYKAAIGEPLHQTQVQVSVND